jgi:hypothetical protein|tara:strand:+ start:339 stop:524 length:186 start_codon:yes stop_codon:yes gene_type:complete
MKYLNDDIINLLRQKKVIEREEVVLKEGDLFVAFNVVTQNRRVVEVPMNLLEVTSRRILRD